jgi:hypothetical protein
LGFGLREFGGLEYLSRAAALSTVREVAVSNAFAAGLFAWVGWTHRSSAALVRASFQSTALATVLVLPLAYVAAVLVALAFSSLVASAVYGVRFWDFATGAAQTVGVSDFGFGLLSVLGYAAALLVFGWFAIPRLAASSWTLLRKIVAVWVALVAARVVVELVAYVVA